MFVVFNIIKAEKGIIKRRRQKKALHRKRLNICRFENCLPFYVLNVLEERRGIDWNIVAEDCGRCASRIIAPKNIVLPDEKGLRRFSPYSMNSLLIFNTALEIIKKASLTPDGFGITLTDKNALLPSRVCELLPFSSCVRVITAYPERYACACSNALDEFGATLIIRPSYEKSTKPDIVICSDSAVVSSMCGCAIFSFRNNFCGKLNFFGEKIELLPKHKEILPENIDSADFAGAVTELCGCTDYKRAAFSQIGADCGICENQAPEKCLKCFVKGERQIGKAINT